MNKGTVAIIGRPNVGKSTLFNALTSSNKSIVDNQPGVTRDRIYGLVKDQDSGDIFTLIDTGGFETKDYQFQPFSENIVWRQTQAAIDEADIIVVVFSAKEGLHPYDQEIVRYLTAKQKRLLFVCNKVDAIEHQGLVMEFYKLGVDEILSISAAHNRGVGDLRKSLFDVLKGLRSFVKNKYSDDQTTKVAIIGRPNVGKSSILNRLIGEERALVSDVAGTTRDPLDCVLRYNHKNYLIIDTAGIRRKSHVKEKLEVICVIRSLRTIEDADVVVLVIDANDGLAEQDLRLADTALSSYKPLLIVVNKWDLISEKDTKSVKQYSDYIHQSLKTGAFVPIVFISCETNQRVAKIMEYVEELATLAHKRVSTAFLNQTLQKLIDKHSPALIQNYTKRVKFYYATQVKANPPTIVIKSNVSDKIQESYRRYLANHLREQLGFYKIPLRLIFRGKGNDNALKYND